MAAATADRQLLFGLLALQNGLIDQGALVAAFQAWARDKSTALADHLVARGDFDPDDRSAIEALVDRHLKKHGGDAQKSLAVVVAGPTTIQSLAEVGDPEVEATLSLVGIGVVGDTDRTITHVLDSDTSCGQRFRIVRPHAQGGLGAVFVALDVELNREVALKQILDDFADDPVSRRRFLVEAEITGGLEHPGIVPVYGLGTYGNGRPYYAMRGSFEATVSRRRSVDSTPETRGTKGGDRGSLELRKLLRRFTDLCKRDRLCPQPGGCCTATSSRAT